MRSVIRHLYAVTSRRLSDQRKQSIKALAKRILPLKVRRYLRRRFERAVGTRGSHSYAKTGLNELDHKLNKEVSSLSRALWMGFTASALADLERIRRTGDIPHRPIARAAESLARWYTTDNKHEIALDRLIHARILNGSAHPERFRVLEHHLLIKLGLFEEANRLFDAWGADSPDLHLMQANLRLHQAVAGDLPRDEADSERLELIDWIFHRRSLVPISDLTNGDGLSFAALGGNLPVIGREVNTKEPVVSIVVPAYNAESTLVASVNSLRAQGLVDIEILIVDDASTDNTYAVAKTLASEDRRIRVLQHGQNLGAYGARNTGLTNATGEYFTVHDSDDWSHPQLIERQLDVLQDGPAVGSFSRLARVSSNLEFLLRPYRPMLEPIHWNYTSLLSETERLRDLGGWDMVRVHADSDLIERIREFYGKDSLVEAETSVPLSFFLVTGNNLTESKDTSLRSVDFGARKEYTEQARFWRRKTFAADEEPSYINHKRESAKSPFFCARSLAANRDQITQSYDLIIGSDLALQGGTRRCNLAYIDCARRLGLRVGIFNMPRYRLRGSGTIDSTYRELFQVDAVDLLTPEDDVVAKTLLVHHPPVLRNAFAGYPSVTAERNYLLVNQLPWEMKDYSKAQYDTLSVQHHYKDAFNNEPTWIPISPRVRRYLRQELQPEMVYDEDWFPIVNWNISSLPRRTEDATPGPVVGRHSRDHATKWPESAETLKKCYLAGSEYEVRLLGGTRAAEEVLGYRPENWVVYPFDSLSVEEFLSEIDIFIHFHHSMYIEEFGRNIAEAMASGVPCILPTEYSETFHAAALYAEPDNVADVIRELWADQDRFGEYSSRGIEFVKKHSALEVGMERIASLLE